MIRFFDSVSVHPYHEGMNRDWQLNDFFREVECKVRRLLRLQQKKSIPNRFDLTDVVQEVNAQICVNARTGESISHFLDTAWLSKVTSGHFCKLQRRNLAKKRSVTKEENRDLESIGYEDMASAVAEIDEQVQIMLDCLEMIDADSRHAIVRRNYDEATFKQISQELNTTEYGARSIYEDGLKRVEGLMRQGIRAK